MQKVHKILNKKVLLASGMLVFSLALVAGFTGAFFSDTETSNENVFQAGTLDLEVGIDSDSTLGNISLASLTGNEALFNFQGLIPGESDGGFFKLESNTDAWACVAPTMQKTYENDRLSPEIASGDASAGVSNGELQNFLQVALWTDVDENGAYDAGTDSDLQVFDVNAFDGTYLSLLDSATGDYMDGGDRREIGFQYCFGVFTNPSDPAAGCDGSNPDINQAQTDSVEVSFAFVGMQYANNPAFMCDSLNPIPEPSVVLGAADMTAAAGARLRSFGNTGGDEVYVGLHDLGVPAGRTAQNLSWTVPGTESLVVAYDSSANTISTTIGSNPASVKSLAGAVCTAWDTAQLAIANRDVDTTVNLNNVMLGSFALGDFDGGVGGDSVDDWQNWTITGFDFSDDFTFTADLELDGTFGSSQELSKVEFLMGCSA